MAHNLPPQGANYDGYSTLAVWKKCIRWGVFTQNEQNMLEYQD